jgi:subtilisin-like proprotein convertase family protein
MRYRRQWMIPFILLLCANTMFAQTWTAIDPANIPTTGKRDILPQTCMTYQLDHVGMKNMLWSAPYEYAQTASSSNTIILVGLADGTADQFRMVQYDMMEAPLAAQYTGIKTFRGISISNPYRRIRADWTVNGFRAVITDLEGQTFIDHYQRNDMTNRIVYSANEYSRETDWTCSLTEEEFFGGDSHEQRIVGDCELRTYRLAVATTGEYSNYFGAMSPAQSATVLAAVVTAVNRVNDVYEADFSTRLLLIGNNNLLFYYDGGSDPYTNNDGGAMLGQNQTTIDGIIGSANYDIGHVFSTGGGGVAYLGAICNASIKAGGVTGSSNPVGDPFVIDYVAHEMGHQFGGNHTQNNACNRNNATAMEPGSASTIMGYAGICSPNIQNNSDAYMHGISLQEIATEINANNCDVVISTANTAPVVANVPNYTIPKSTPFVLTASATDDDNDPMTYCWEQWDQEVGAVMPPASTNIVGPMFRSLIPSASPSRYFPNLPAIIAGTNPTWEVLPSVARSMEFRVTIRDLYDGMYGCTDEDNTILTVSGSAGPFVVTSQNIATNWYEGAMETITWDVANTSAAPVSCANVDIRLSTDGGLTYPIVLALNEPNDGSATVLIPAGTTTTGRVMVKASTNIFFDINNANISIIQALPNFTLDLSPSSVIECNDGSVQTTVVVGQFLGFSDPVTLSILNLPPGATASFVPPVVNPGGTSLLTVSNLAGLFGIYTPVVRGSSTNGNMDELFTITLLATPTSAPTLLSPANNTPDAVITPLLDWQIVSGVTQYEYQVAYDNAFANIALAGTTTTDKHQVTSTLLVGQQYYWRVRGGNSCGNGAWSSTFTFTTVSCFALMSTNVPVTIPASGTPTVTSVFNCPVDMLISDVNVINLTGSHSWVDDLKFTLIAPDASERLIWDQPCGNDDNFNINFDDEAANSNWPCPPVNGLTYRPNNTLSFFDGKQAEGAWTLRIQDIADQDGGSLTSWGLKVCGDLGCQLTVNQTTGTGTGSLSSAISCANPGDTIRIAAVLEGQTIDVGPVPLFVNKDLVFMAESTGINITGSGTRVFEIRPGVHAVLIGLDIKAGTSPIAGAVLNPGTVTLKDVIMRRNTGVQGATLIENSPGAQLFVVGNCYIYQ